MITEVTTLSNQIRSKLDLFYRKGTDYKVLVDNDTIVIKGRTKALSGTYRYYLPGEIVLSVESAKKFLDSLDRVIIINNYLGENGISFKITRGIEIVFEKDGKEISDSDIMNLYRTLEMKQEKNSLPLALNMIKAKSLYERYVDLYEQVEKKHEFLEKYNELISTFKGRKEAIQFAKANKGTWGRIRRSAPSREFDITGDEDLVDTIINGENVFFSYGTVPLDKKKTYLTNLDNYELRINNLIERLEIETQKLEEYNKQASSVLESISNFNPLNIRPILNVPKYECVSLDIILTEEKEKYDREVNKKQHQSSEPAPTKDEYPWLKDVDQRQRESLGKDAKTAIMLYKSFMYHVFNHIISYARINNIGLDKLKDDPQVENFIREEYASYKERMEQPQMRMSGSSTTVTTVVDDLFPKNRVIDYDRFRQIVLDNVVLLEPALTGTLLTQPLTVYRCVYEPISSEIYDGDLGNSLLSTSTSVEVVSTFLDQRKPDINYDSKKVIYKIELPAGSPIIAFTNDVYLKNGTQAAGFGDDQKEILLDSKAYDFEYVDADFARMEDGTYLYFVTLKAIPKIQEEQLTH